MASSKLLTLMRNTKSLNLILQVNLELSLLLSRFSCVWLCAIPWTAATRLRRPWDSPGKNTGVGCHFLLQCMRVKNQNEVIQLCPILSDLMDYSLPGSSVHGIFQARVLEWDAIAFSRIWGKELHFVHLCISSHFLVQPALAHCLISSCCCLVAQSCPTLCDPMDCSPPGSSVHGISQARILDGLPFPSPGDLPNPGIESMSPVWQADSLPLNHQGSSYIWK